jgi:predicted HAD superfamily phosphohydrolase YqeG
MNLALTIHRMAFREASTLGVAQVLVAQKRAELEHELTLQQANEGRKPTGAVIERAINDMQLESDQTVRALEHRVDRWA